MCQFNTFPAATAAASMPNTSAYCSTWEHAYHHHSITSSIANTRALIYWLLYWPCIHLNISVGMSVCVGVCCNKRIYLEFKYVQSHFPSPLWSIRRISSAIRCIMYTYDHNGKQLDGFCQFISELIHFGFISQSTHRPVSVSSKWY